MDRRYIDIGLLPSNGNVDYSFDSISVRAFELGDLTPLFTAITQSNMHNLIKSLQHCVDVDLMELTEGDLLYVMGWIRMFSYPKSSVIVTWKCNHQVIENSISHIEFDPRFENYSDDKLSDTGHKRTYCLRKNTVPLTQVSIKQYKLPEEIPLPDFLTLPRVKSLVEFDEYYSDDSELSTIAGYARWMKAGDSLEDKIKQLRKHTRRHGVSVISDITSYRERFFHGIKDVMRLDCCRCDHKSTVERVPDIIKFFSVTSEESILNMQYNLSSAIGIQTDQDTPSKNLLYWHACYEKDRIEKEEKKRMQEAQKKNRR